LTVSANTAVLGRQAKLPPVGVSLLFAFAMMPYDGLADECVDDEERVGDHEYPVPEQRAVSDEATGRGKLADEQPMRHALAVAAFPLRPNLVYERQDQHDRAEPADCIDADLFHCGHRCKFDTAMPGGHRPGALRRAGSAARRGATSSQRRRVVTKAGPTNWKQRENSGAAAAERFVQSAIS